MTQHMSKSEKFVREHYPGYYSFANNKLPSAWVESNLGKNNLTKNIRAYDQILWTTSIIGTGLTRLEAWRDAARNIRNNLKQQP
jgi:hypothetical protein